MFWDKKEEILTEFVESESGNVLYSIKMPVQNLPDTFENETTFDIEDEQYSVIDAFPKNKDEFVKAGKLKIYLRKIEKINFQDILYSLPTIENTFFDAKPAEFAGNFLQIHEDDWRQMEFVSGSFEDKVNQEIADILAIYQNEMKNQFFKKIHVRQRIPNPFGNLKIGLADLEQHFNVDRRYDGFQLDVNNIAKNSFAFATSEGSTYFGIVDSENRVQALCIKEFNEGDGTLKSILEKFNLIFVNWPQMKKM